MQGGICAIQEDILRGRNVEHEGRPFSSTENLEAMMEAVSMVKTGQVTYAVRDTHIDDKEIHEGDIMGIGDAGILAVGKSVDGTTKDMLAQLVNDDSELISLYYGEEVSDCFKNLFTQHLLIAADLVNAAKSQEAAKAEAARRAWYANADQIAKFLSEINPCWHEARWKALLYDHLEMTEKEAVLRLNGKYAEDIQVFDSIEAEALKMADYMSQGIIRQFCFC